METLLQLTQPEPSAQHTLIYRDNAWLNDRLETIRKVHFSDVAHGFPIDIKFGIRARYRFGSIAARNRRTVILINQLFADPIVPDYVVDSTIVHEMAHYAHGFGSGLPRLYTDPHRGGVIDKELAKRGLMAMTELSEKWRTANWETHYNANCSDIRARKDQKLESVTEQWSSVFTKKGARSEEQLRQILHKILKRLGTAAGEAVFQVGWLEASVRQAGTSYWFPGTQTVRLHGLLADTRVPITVVEFELTYWIIRLRVGNVWSTIHAEMKRVGCKDVAEEALRWRQSSWNTFRKRNHPLK